MEERLPGVQVNWKQFGGPTAIREGMLAGEVDFGFMGPAPVLMGIDNGMEWKYAPGISFNEMAIVVNRPEIQSLRDFTPEDRIAVLSPACTQHVLPVSYTHLKPETSAENPKHGKIARTQTEQHADDDHHGKNQQRKGELALLGLPGRPRRSPANGRSACRRRGVVVFL